ncbi:MAG: sulfatase-like hydrolase/transferase, partial [Chloroflexota bacterium]
MPSTRRDLLKLAAALAGGALASRVLPRALSLGQAAERPNVLILLFDTMTAPHLSVYGYPRKTTPNFERFAQRATVYHRHYSSGSYTIPGTASILTGLYPWNHRAINLSGPVRRDLAGNNIFRAVGPEYYRIGWGQNLWVEMFLRQFRADIDEHLPPDWSAFKNPLLLGEMNPRDPMVYLAYDEFLVGGVKLDTPYAGSVLLGLLDIAVGRGENVNPVLSQAMERQNIPFNFFFYYQNGAVFQGIFNSVQAARRRQPFFGYYHLWSPHDPYAPAK